MNVPSVKLSGIAILNRNHTFFFNFGISTQIMFVQRAHVTLKVTNGNVFRVPFEIM